MHLWILYSAPVSVPAFMQPLSCEGFRSSIVYRSLLILLPVDLLFLDSRRGMGEGKERMNPLQASARVSEAYPYVETSRWARKSFTVAQ